MKEISEVEKLWEGSAGVTDLVMKGKKQPKCTTEQ